MSKSINFEQKQILEAKTRIWFSCGCCGLVCRSLGGREVVRDLRKKIQLSTLCLRARRLCLWLEGALAAIGLGPEFWQANRAHS